VAWDDASLQQAGDLAPLFNVPVETVDMVKKLLPIVRRLGLDMVLKFPLRPDAKAIPLADPAVAMAKVKPEEAAATAVVKFEIKYDQQGVPGILGITAQDLLALGISAPLALDMNAIRALQARNVQFMELRTKPDGLYVYVNGNPLPNLVWDNTLLTSAADMYGQTNPTSPYVEVVKQALPTLDNMDIGVLVHFPLAAGATPITAKMH
jgi:hypothetical protein